MKIDEINEKCMKFINFDQIFTISLFFRFSSILEMQFKFLHIAKF